MNFHKRVWDTLSALDVGEHTEDKQGFTYLSWAWAWGILMDHFPQSTFTNDETVYHPDDTATVSVTVTVRMGSDKVVRTMTLPVLDSIKGLKGMQPIVKPNTFQLNKAHMRCLVKCLALFGLGINIYAGEDVPMYSDDAVEDVLDTLVNIAPVGLQQKFYKACGSEDGSAIPMTDVPDTKKRPALKWLKGELEKLEAA